jgi:hypothetical protein
LSELEDQAREQAEQADDLPESSGAREDLRRANERAAEAAERLADAQLPATARDELEELRDRLPSELP